YFFEDAEDFAYKIMSYAKLDSTHKQQMHDNALESVQVYDREAFIQNVLCVYSESIRVSKEAMVLTEVNHKHAVGECQLENKYRSLSVLVSMEMFVELGLRKGKELEKEVIETLLENEQFVKAYQSCIQKISVKDRSRKEMYDFLIE